MPSSPISGSLDLTQSTGVFTINTASFLGYSFDMIISDLADVSGTIYIFCQNANPQPIFSILSNGYAPKMKYEIITGSFAAALLAQVVDSAYLTSSQFCSIAWELSSGSVGALNIVGFAKVFV